MVPSELGDFYTFYGEYFGEVLKCCTILHICVVGALFRIVFLRRVCLSHVFSLNFAEGFLLSKFFDFFFSF